MVSVAFPADQYCLSASSPHIGTDSHPQPQTRSGLRSSIDQSEHHTPGSDCFAARCLYPAAGRCTRRPRPDSQTRSTKPLRLRRREQKRGHSTFNGKVERPFSCQITNQNSTAGQQFLPESSRLCQRSPTVRKSWAIAPSTTDTWVDRLRWSQVYYVRRLGSIVSAGV